MYNVKNNNQLINHKYHKMKNIINKKKWNQIKIYNKIIKINKINDNKIYKNDNMMNNNFRYLNKNNIKIFNIHSNLHNTHKKNNNSNNNLDINNKRIIKIKSYNANNK